MGWGDDCQSLDFGTGILFGGSLAFGLERGDRLDGAAGIRPCGPSPEPFIPMLHWTLVFLVLALVAALLGFGGIAASAAGIAKILFFIFLILWLVSFVMRGGRK